MTRRKGTQHLKPQRPSDQIFVLYLLDVTNVIVVGGIYGYLAAAERAEKRAWAALFKGSKIVEHTIGEDLFLEIKLSNWQPIAETPDEDSNVFVASDPHDPGPVPDDFS